MEEASMKSLTLACAALAAILALLLPAAPAQALLKTFVSSTGSNANPCTFAAPCADFQVAHAATDPGGQIACLNSGDFFGASITKSITMDCAGTSNSVFGFIINAAGIVVTIRNLTMFGNNIGIDFQTGAALFVENCTIRNMNTNIPALGIRFAPSAPGAQLVVSDTVIKNNGIAPATGGGIQVAPQAGGSAGVSLTRVTFGSNRLDEIPSMSRRRAMRYAGARSQASPAAAPAQQAARPPRRRVGQ
jgi:Right handed beta helix region